ncbi:MAG: hypothetical protein QG608_3450, partial [Actinomycetota bacterium]|nr:hypothetical protein [Actinomycetota bacterium]
MGRISGPYGRREHDVDVLVVGYGRAGRAAVRAAHAAGRTVLAVDAGQAGRTLLPPARGAHGTPEDRSASEGPQEEVLPARAHFLGPHHVELRPLGVDVATGETEVHARRVIIATGTCPVYPEATGLADTRFMIGVGAHRLVPSDVPLGPTGGPVRAVATLRAGNGPLPFELSDLADRSVVVLGAGRTGCSVAWALAVLGAQVTLVEAAERVLPRLDPGLSAAAAQALQEADVRVMLRARATGLAPTLDEGAWIGTQKAGDVAAEHLVLATGHRPFTSGLDLQSAGVRLSPSGAVPVDGECRTTGSGVLAAGEVTGCSRETAAPMGLFAGTCVAHGRFGRRPAWSEPLLPVT